MALGFLFMGAGTLTFGTSPEAGEGSPAALAVARCGHGTVLCTLCSHSPCDGWSVGVPAQQQHVPGTRPPPPPAAVAALVISLFPRFPASTMDHRCHLQARVGKGT